MMHGRSLLLMLVVLLVGLVYTPVMAQERGVTDDEVILGTSAPLSGPAAAWGAVARGAEAYVQHINEQGGIHGRTIRFVTRDDAYLPARAVGNVRELVDREGVFGIVGLIGSANAMAVRDYVVNNEIIWMTPAADANMWVGYPNLDDVFVTYPNYYQEAIILGRYAVEELGKERVAVVYQNDAYGQTGLAGVEEALDELGMDVVAAVPYDLTATDLSVHALSVQRADADAVILYATPRHGALMAGALHGLDPKPQVLASFTLADPIMYHLAGAAWDGVIVPSYFPFPGTDPKVDQVLEILLQQNPELQTTPFNALAGVSFLEPFLEGMRRAGPDLTKASLVEAMESINNWDGELLRDVTFGPDRRQGIDKIFLVRTDQGQPAQISDWIEYPVEF